MSIFNRKTMITIEQLAAGIVWVPHMPNETNKEALDCLIKAFQTVEEEKRITLEVEYTAFSFSLLWFRYMSYVQVKHASKLDSFNNMVTNCLKSYFQKAYPPVYIDTIWELYGARIESYQNAYNTSNHFENIADLLLWYIGFGLIKGEPCPYPVKVPVSHPVFPDLHCKTACTVVTDELWKFIDKHMEGLKIV